MPISKRMAKRSATELCDLKQRLNGRACVSAKDARQKEADVYVGSFDRNQPQVAVGEMIHGTHDANTEAE